MGSFRLPGTDDENYRLHPVHGAPIRVVRETVCYVMLAPAPPSEARPATNKIAIITWYPFSEASDGGRQDTDRVRWTPFVRQPEPLLKV
jgi:hypothetical protein